MKANKQIQRKCKTPRLQLDAYQDLLDDKKGKKVINLFLFIYELQVQYQNFQYIHHQQTVLTDKS